MIACAFVAEQIPHAIGEGPANGLAAHSAFPMSTHSTSSGVEFLVFGGTCGHDPEYEGEGHRDVMVNSLWKCSIKLPLSAATTAEAQLAAEEKIEPAPIQIRTAM